MGYGPVGSPYTFTMYSIHVMGNLPTWDCQTMWTIIFFTSWQCSSFVMGNVQIGSPCHFTRICSIAFMLWEIYLTLSGSAGHLWWPLYQWLLNHKKLKCSFLDYVQLLIIDQAFRATKVAQNAIKWSPNRQNMKCSFLDYIHLLSSAEHSKWWKLPKMQKKATQIIKKWNAHF